MERNEGQWSESLCQAVDHKWYPTWTHFDCNLSWTKNKGNENKMNKWWPVAKRIKLLHDPNWIFTANIEMLTSVGRYNIEPLLKCVTASLFSTWRVKTASTVNLILYKGNTVNPVHWLGCSWETSSEVHSMTFKILIGYSVSWAISGEWFLHWV